MDKTVSYVKVEKIIPNRSQPRQIFNDDALNELAQSIETYGIIQPISLRKFDESTFEIVAGERRFRAAKLIGLSEVPSIIVDLDEKDSAFVALLENVQREDLNFIEEAEAYSKLLKDYNYTQGQLAEVMGKKQSTIANKLRILKLPKEVRSLLIENNLTERHGRALLKLPSEELQLEILKKVIDKELNVKNTEELIKLELHKLENAEIAADGKKKIKGIFSPRIYMNTIKQTFDKFGVNATYRSKELDDSIEIVVKIPKK
ncbi:nucleoid occlusion protein [Oceanirhabdus sp. W0125-5]|uniref:nucleoid occlusion protein n=1 Tax=Oceanirhabdus sp. W0125-5 TaxID=2999116 RepID=UPI0022F32F69|nr:nucleoid occlusion protein [Oceanirhabdus sp. W0125-5]WBW97614.1 nucleoid occlusion protein [Oceanirhabdus sp. W0125-5]